LGEQYNNMFIGECRDIINRFSTENCNRLESTYSVASIDHIEQGIEAAIVRHLRIVKTRTVAYNASLYGKLMSMVLVSITVICFFSLDAF
jgi:hypothetical protein